MDDPFDIDGPAIISFSGGRTSGFMLRAILDRGIRDDVHVLFCNTGKEDDRTLDFVRNCAVRWSVDIRWLQYRRRYLPRYKSERVANAAAAVRAALGLNLDAAPEGAKEPGYIEVSYETAARTADAPTLNHPFTNLIAVSGVPNAATRLCTTEMKIRVMKRFMLAQGYDAWTNVVGIRADEPRRAARMRVKPPERWDNAVPLADAGITEQDVLQFWRSQPFDLGLAVHPELGTYQGNCDLCMLKSDAKKVRAVREHPSSVDWWEQMETISGSRFRPRVPYRAIRHLALAPTFGAAPDNVLSEIGDCICHD